MKPLFLSAVLVLTCQIHLEAQEALSRLKATEIVHQSQSESNNATPVPIALSAPVIVPAGTSIEVESAYTVSSASVRPGELLTFRVLVPIMINGAAAIEEGALVTARVMVAKRGGHWGKAGRLSWNMVDVIAADGTRILLSPETAVRNTDWLLIENRKQKDGNVAKSQGTVKGISHKKEVATRTVVAAAIFPPLAPLALLHGFKRGENAILPEGKRFVVVVKSESPVVPKQIK